MRQIPQEIAEIAEKSSPRPLLPPVQTPRQAITAFSNHEIHETHKTKHPLPPHQISQELAEVAEKTSPLPLLPPVQNSGQSPIIRTAKYAKHTKDYGEKPLRQN